jgi:hypothetical protein
VLTTEEIEILEYLKTVPQEFVSFKEISRRAGGKKRYREEPEWARPFLRLLLNKDLVEVSETGHYRYRQPKKPLKKMRWVSPQIAKILEKSGKSFEIIE